MSRPPRRDRSSPRAPHARVLRSVLPGSSCACGRRQPLRSPSSGASRSSAAGFARATCCSRISPSASAASSSPISPRSCFSSSSSIFCTPAAGLYSWRSTSSLTLSATQTVNRSGAAGSRASSFIRPKPAPSRSRCSRLLGLDEVVRGHRTDQLEMHLVPLLGHFLDRLLQLFDAVALDQERRVQHHQLLLGRIVLALEHGVLELPEDGRAVALPALLDGVADELP